MSENPEVTYSRNKDRCRPAHCPVPGLVERLQQLNGDRARRSRKIIDATPYVVAVNEDSEAINAQCRVNPRGPFCGTVRCPLE